MMTVDDAGGTSTFEQFFRDEYRRLLPVLRAVTGDRDLAEDLAQEALAKAQRDWEQVVTFDRPSAWLRRVAMNAMVNTWRRRRREAAAMERVGTAAGPVDVSLELAGDDDELWVHVRGLPDQQRWAVALHYVEDLPIAEVAEVLGCSEGTVKTHLSRARGTLGRQLGGRRGARR